MNPATGRIRSPVLGRKPGLKNLRSWVNRINRPTKFPWPIAPVCAGGHPL